MWMEDLYLILILIFLCTETPYRNIFKMAEGLTSGVS
uniref:Uncharacterized protein n=1 Tax=Anguilla anguilla TaxID=7936 RepID=A0A0E9Q8G8_ANGAN